VVRLGGDALDQCRRRTRQDLHGHRGRAGDPLYRPRRILHTGADLLTARQPARLDALFAADAHSEAEATWAIYQPMITAYREPDQAKGRAVMEQLIASISTGVPAALHEVTTLGRTLARRAADILAGVPDVFRIGDLLVSQAAEWFRNHSCSASFGVRYPNAEWSRF